MKSLASASHPSNTGLWSLVQEFKENHWFEYYSKADLLEIIISLSLVLLEAVSYLGNIVSLYLVLLVAVSYLGNIVSISLVSLRAVSYIGAIVSL